MSFEFQILDWLQTIHMPVLDKIMITASSLASVGLIWVCLAVLLLLIPKTRELGLVLAIGLLIEFICCNVILKPLVARTRPYDINKGVQLIVNAPKDYSFPSGHSGISFAAVGSLFFAKSRLWIPSLILAIVIAFSRLYLYVHYPTDVLTGMVLGILCGWAGNKIILIIDKKLSSKKNTNIDL